VRMGDRPYEVFTPKDGDIALDKIEVFEKWFSFSFEVKPVWYSLESAPQNSTPGPPVNTFALKPAKSEARRGVTCTMRSRK
jgi:hypothetical protein